MFGLLSQSQLRVLAPARGVRTHVPTIPESPSQIAASKLRSDCSADRPLEREFQSHESAALLVA